MSCVTWAYLPVFCLVVGADAWLCVGVMCWTTTTSAAPLSPQAQLMAKYADQWLLANRRGMHAMEKAKQAVSTNGFGSAKREAHRATKEFTNGFQICQHALGEANGLNEPARFGATQVIQIGKQRLSNNLECSELLERLLHQQQKLVGPCFKGWATKTASEQTPFPSPAVATLAPPNTAFASQSPSAAVEPVATRVPPTTTLALQLPPATRASPITSASQPSSVGVSRTAVVPSTVQRWQRVALLRYTPSVFATSVALGATLVLLGLLMAGLAGAFLRCRSMSGSVLAYSGHLTEMHSME